jgi:hypothetical protein
MRFAHRLFPMALVAAIVSGLPLAASAAWRFEENGPYRVKKAEAVDITPKETRSLAPKPGVALARPVAPRAPEPPVGARSMAPKKGVAFARPIAPRGPGLAPERSYVSD